MKRPRKRCALEDKILSEIDALIPKMTPKATTIERMTNESDLEWTRRKTQNHLDNAERNMVIFDRNWKQIVWMWKWLLIPMWVFIISSRIIRYSYQ